MEPTIEEKTNPVKRFIDRHKVGLAVTATAIAGAVVTRVAVRQHDEFLKEHDLYDKFYTPDADE